MLHSIAYVATELGCGRTRVFELIRQRELSSLKVGRRRMISDDSLRAFISRQLERP
jgi:excisionase family DNA binding protein